MAARAKAKRSLASTARAKAPRPAKSPRPANALRPRAEIPSALAVAPVPQDVFLPRLTILALVLLLTAYVFVFQSLVPAQLVYTVLLLSAAVWFAFEQIVQSPSARDVKKAAVAGFVLASFIFLYENTGLWLGDWSLLQRAFVLTFVPLKTTIVFPVEYLATCLVGGAAWFLYLPKKFNALHSAMDVFSFAVYGAVGEYVLQLAGLIIYHPGWGFWWAILAYAIIGIGMHYLKYRVINK